MRAFVANLKPGESLPAPESNTVPVIQRDPLDYSSARTILELPDKPSIAVLPFTNLSADPEQE